MPMATEALDLHRRRLLQAAACTVVAAGVPAQAGSGRGARLLAAWDDPGAREPHHMGLLEVDTEGRLAVLASIALPTRAHGLVWEAASGTALAVARRPGDWLLRWRPASPARAAQWQWSPPQRRFNGHALRVGNRVMTTETDFDAGGRGVVVVRDAASLRELALWDSHGQDPHALLWDAGRQGLWVANGGIGSDLGSGRRKDLRAMDSSLVLLDAAANGAPRGQWRLDDPRLSMRHLARADDGSVGVALQAEHDDAARRETAPLLAVWQAGTLRIVDHDGIGGGYGGDIAAVDERFYVSATRSDQVLAWSARDRSVEWRTIDGAGALTRVDGTLWCGSDRGWTPLDQVSATKPQPLARPGLRPDNHALGLPV